jgi:hypothetical protein
MSFSITTKQIEARTKTVTRRLGWANLKPGEIFCAVEKCMGLKRGEKVKKLAVLRCVSNSSGPLFYLVANARYGKSEARKEGFPELSGAEFVKMFCKKMGTHSGQSVNRIEFEYVE